MVLAKIGHDVFAQFKGVLEDDAASNHEVITESLHQRLFAESERYKLWAINIGLFVLGHGSLDYRLRAAENVARTVYRLLDDLSAALERCKVTMPEIYPKY
jgi:hypothetical protein